METVEKSGVVEYRIDIRGQAGKVTRVRLLEREGGEKFRQSEGDFTDAHARHIRLFAKAVSVVAKSIVPPLNIDAVVSDLNAPRRNKRIVSKRTSSQSNAPRK